MGRDVEETDGVAGQDLLGVTGDGVPSCCQRMQPTLNRAISLLRCPDNQVSVTAQTGG
ncbi:hypothetical protein KAURM247S_06389 [Kitasatospora aureofaciens]